jgi:hypothetical protein
MLATKHVNSITTFAFSFIKLSKEVVISISSLNFPLVDMKKIMHYLTTNDP